MSSLFTNRFKTLLAVAGIAVATPFAAHAFGGHEYCGGPMMHREMGFGGPEGGAMHLPPFVRELKLSDAQRDQIFKIMHDQAPAFRDKAIAARKAHEELRDMAFSARYDEARVAALSDTEARAMAELTQMRLRTGNQIYQVLTPEQKKKADELKADFETRMTRPVRDGGQPGKREPLRN